VGAVGGGCIGGGILEVAQIVAKHRHAVRRDLVLAGFPGDTPIHFGDFISIVLASPPGSAVRYAAMGGVSQTDELLMNLGEQYAGLRTLEQPYARHAEIPDEPMPEHVPMTMGGTPMMTPQTVEEYNARRVRDLARGAELAATDKRIG